MNSPKRTNKTTHFASNNQVFNYSLEQTVNQDDSLLLTPQSHQNRIIPNPPRSQHQVEVNSANKMQLEIDQFQQEVKRKREEFLRRMTSKRAIFQSSQPASEVAQSQPYRENGSQQSSLVDFKAKSIEEEHNANAHIEAINQQQIQGKSQFKQMQSMKKQRSPFSSDTKEKVDELNRVRLLKRQNLREEAEEETSKFKQERKGGRRVTLDLKSLLDMNFLTQGSNPNASKKKKQFPMVIEESKLEWADHNRQSGNSQGPVKNNHSPQQNRRMSLMNRAIQRLSGGNKVPQRPRVTLNMNEVLSVIQSTNVHKEQMIQKIDSIKQNKDSYNQTQQEREHIQTKKTLKKYFQETNIHDKKIDEQMAEINQKKKHLKDSLKQKQSLIRHLQIQLAKTRGQNEDIQKQDEKYQQTLKNSEDAKSNMAPIFYLEQNYNIKLIKFQLNHTPTPYSNYQLDFILDGQIYCRLKRVDNSHPTVNIRESAMWRTLPPSWVIDCSLRVEILFKFTSHNITRFEPMLMLLHIAELYEKIQELESDLKILQLGFGIKDFIFESFSNQLSVTITEIMHEMYVKATISLLDINCPTFFELEFIPKQASSSIHPRVMKDRGIDKTLAEFIYECMGTILLS